MTELIESKKGLATRFRELVGVKEDSESGDQIAILMAMLLGLTENTWSGDVMELSIYEEVNETLKKFGQFAKAMRNNNPMARAFFGEDQ